MTSPFSIIRHSSSPWYDDMPLSPPELFQPIHSRSSLSRIPSSPYLIPPSPTPISTSDLIQWSHEILRFINQDRTALRKNIPLIELDKLTAKIDSHIQSLSLTLESLDHKLTRLCEHKTIEALNLDPLSLRMSSLSLDRLPSIEQGLIDPSTKPCSNLLEKKSQKIQHEETSLKTALLALCHYGEVLHALQDAKKAGCLLDETIQLPAHLHDINDYIFFLGEDFHDFKEVGEGAWGKVSKCSLADKSYAIKTPLNTSHWIQNMREPDKIILFDNDSNRDIYIPLILSHPNIIKICGIFDKKPILEYIKDGSLADQFSSKFRLTDKDTLSILSDIASGLNYLHEKGLIHKDIKPDNILLEKIESGYRPVICDFGTTVAKQAKTHHYAGTEPYLPPEMVCYLAIKSRNIRKAFNEAPITEAMDVWAFGHIIYQMTSGGRHLFEDRAIGASTKGNPLYQKRSTGYATICYSLKETYTFEYLQESCLKSQKKSQKGVSDPLIRDELLRIASSCLQKKAENRPSMEGVFSRLEVLK